MNGSFTDNLLIWLSSLPLGSLYCMSGGAAAIENVFPPFPSDVVAAVAIFLAAHKGGSFWTAAFVTWAGNVAGAMAMYGVGRKYGSLALLQKLQRWAGNRAAMHLQTMHAKYGVWALFISRFLPGVRALVPPFAGALNLPAWHVGLAIGAASGLWYALLSYLAYQAGERWDLLLRLVAHSTKWVGLIALAVVLVWGVVWYIRRPSKTHGLS